MNVCLQALLSMPAFFNMLVAISESQEVMNELGPESLIRKFVQLSLYFNPLQQLDRKSGFALRVVDAEKIFAELNQNFNPYQEHQDCQEFLALILDLLHDELKLIYTAPDDSATADEWHEVGQKKVHFNNDQNTIQSSLIREVFGGVMRNEFTVMNSKQTSVNFEPFFIINLEITKCEDL